MIEATTKVQESGALGVGGRMCVCLPPTTEEVNAIVRLSVCLSVSKITQKRVHGFP